MSIRTNSVLSNAVQYTAPQLPEFDVDDTGVLNVTIPGSATNPFYKDSDGKLNIYLDEGLNNPLEIDEVTGQIILDRSKLSYL